jgi:hypothetical protein
MTFPSRLVLHGAGFAGDGGTILLRASDEEGVEHEIILTQHAYHYTRNPQHISGRLYFAGEIVPIRSAREAEIMAILRCAEIRYLSKGVRAEQFDDDLRNARNSVIEYIESPRYLSFAAEQETDEQTAPDS